MNTIASQITSLTIVYLTVNSGTDHRKHQSSASLAFVRGIHRRPVNSPHKGPVTRKMFPFDDVIMIANNFIFSITWRCHGAHLDVLSFSCTPCSRREDATLGLYSLSGKTSYRQISWSLEAARLGVIIIAPLWNLTGTSAALLPRGLSNFRAIGKV